MLYRIVAGLARLGEIKTEEPCSLVLGDLSRNSKGLAGRGPIFLGELFRLPKDLHDPSLFIDFVGVAHGICLSRLRGATLLFSYVFLPFASTSSEATEAAPIVQRKQ